MSADSNILDLCCGAGGFSCGMRKAGFKIKYGVDLDPKVKETFEHNFPEAEFIQEDILELDPHDFKDKVQVVIGSPPCDNFSKANKNKDEDIGMILIHRFLEFIKVIEPKYWIMENVAEAEKFIKWRTPNSEIPRIKILNSANYGVAQTRFRVFSGNYTFPKPTHYHRGGTNLFGGVIRQWITIRRAINDLMRYNKNKILSRAELGNEKTLYKHKPQIMTKPCTTIRTKPSRTEMYYEFKPNHFRQFTIQEVKRLMGFPDDFEVIGGKKSQFKQMGNAVVPVVAYYIGKAIIQTI